MKPGEIIQLQTIKDRRGNLSVIEDNIPFEIKRVYWTYDIPSGASRGGHAHKTLKQIVVASSGSFRVTLDNGKTKESYILKHPWEGLLINPGIWRTLDDFSSGAVCLVLASEVYDESDYIRNYRDFLKWKKL